MLQNFKHTTAAGSGCELLEFVATAVVVSPDGRRVLTVKTDGTARVWEFETGKPIGAPLRIANHDSIAFSPDGRRLLAVAHDRTTRIWTVDSPHRGCRTAPDRATGR
jgi:WD40 repeat protein